MVDNIPKRLDIVTWTVLFCAIAQLWLLTNVAVYRPGSSYPLVQDGFGYYAYLPGIFIHDDLSFRWAQDAGRFDSTANVANFLRKSPHTGKFVNKYTVGVAVMESPFFLIAHAVTLNSNTYPADGFSYPYRFAVSLAAWFYHVLGLIFLAALLRKWYRKIAIALTLLAISLGTGLLFYTFQEGGMSHVYSFAAFAGLLLFTSKFYARPRFIGALALGVMMGVIFLIRPVNVLAWMIPALYGVRFSRESLLDRYNWTLQHLPKVSFLLFAAAIFMLPNLIYWHQFGGKWIYFAYQGEGFYWLKPAILRVLFSYQAGWLIYSPVMGTALVGFVFLRKYAPDMWLSLLCYFFLTLYVTASWWSWWYGGSLGMRALIETAAPMSISMAAFFQYVVRSKTSLLLWSGFVGLLIIYNIWVSYQYRRGFLHYEKTNRTVFWEAVTTFSMSEEEKKTLHALGTDPVNLKRY